MMPRTPQTDGWDADRLWNTIFNNTTDEDCDHFGRDDDWDRHGGTADDPQPLPGNKIASHYAIEIKGSWTPVQQTAADRFMSALGSDAFTEILTNNGLTR